VVGEGWGHGPFNEDILNGESISKLLIPPWIRPMPRGWDDPPIAEVIAFVTARTKVIAELLAYAADAADSDIEGGFVAYAVGDEVEVRHS
jgi:hypothetical protein